MEKIKQILLQHFYSSWWIYFFIFFCFIAGLVFGSLGVNSLNDGQLNFLTQSVDSGLTQYNDNTDFINITQKALVKNLYDLVKIFLLGLTVIGLPLIVVIVFTRGFALGFTTVFLIEHKGFSGIGLSLLAILPQNLLSLPAYILGAVAATNFTLLLIRGKDGMQRKNIGRYLVNYVLVMMALVILMASAAIIEGYLAPVCIRMFY